MNQKLNNEIQILINKYKYGDFNGVLNKCSSLVKKFPKMIFVEFNRIEFSKNW